MENEYLIKKWLNNDLTEAEAKAFHALNDAEFYQEIIDEANRFDGATHAKVRSFDAIDNLLEAKPSKLNWIKTASKIAAILLIGIAIFTFLRKDNINTFDTVVAQNETITLPDNSIVKLNELSQLEYNASNWNKERTLSLKGEAFFDVEKGKRFDVNTESGKVSVLGTEFNVLSRDSIFKVSCYEGLVQVTYRNENIKLPAGSEVVITSGNVHQTTITIAEPYWLKNMSVFENVAIANVINEIEKQFNVDVLIQFNEKDLMFTGAFEHNSLENALKSITKPLNLTYTIQNTNEVIIRNGQN
ncbi:FecR family protein [Psychroserpens mesophilus]|uniref:FecR family protein n=1 Tax=Psychroserpens mesophilus TaxID=325473 RepID=UPI00058D5D66|nr:FecR family protein [Psychroserpens mesophilus]